MNRNWTLLGMALAWVGMAEGKGQIGINAFTTNTNIFNASVPKGQFRQSPEIGIRYFPTGNWAVDFAVGGGMNDGVQGDSITRTTETAASHAINMELGVFCKLLEEDKAYFGLSGAAGFSNWKLEETDKVKNANSIAGVTSYSYTAPYVTLGIEPGYFFNDHFSLYSRFGITAVYYPDTKYIDVSDPAYNPATHSLPLKKRTDSNSSWSTSQLGLGVRFFF